MSKEEITQVIITQITARLPALNGQVKPDSSLRSLGVDSFALVDLVQDFEERFGVDIPNEKIYELTTVNHIADFIMEGK